MNSKVRGLLQELSRCREGYSSAHMLASVANSYPAGTLSEAALMWCISLYIKSLHHSIVTCWLSRQTWLVHALTSAVLCLCPEETAAEAEAAASGPAGDWSRGEFSAVPHAAAPTAPSSHTLYDAPVPLLIALHRPMCQNVNAEISTLHFSVPVLRQQNYEILNVVL